MNENLKHCLEVAMDAAIEAEDETTAEKLKAILLPCCSCGGAGMEEHTCPYAEEIGGDSEFTCTCCEYCTNQCAWDI